MILGSKVLIGMVALPAALGLVACGDDDTTATASVTPSAASATVSGSAPSTVAATATTTTPASPTAPGPRQLLFDGVGKPQPPEVTKVLPAPPASPFPAWDGKSTVIYDTQTQKAIDVGSGAQAASFSPDETKATWAMGTDWANGTEVFVADLPSGRKRSLGAGRTSMFLDNTHVVVFAVGGNERILVDVTTGTRTPYTGDASKLFLLVPPVQVSPQGYLVEPNDYGGPTTRRYTVKDTTGRVLLTFDAVAVAAAGPGEIAVAGPETNGASDIFIVDIAKGTSTFVAHAQVGRDNWPFSASERYVVWTDNYCGTGPVSVFDRQSGQLVRWDISAAKNPSADLRYVRLTPGGLIAAGSFGAKYLIDPATLAFKTVLPDRPDGYGGDVSWSADFRYASHGPFGGHGGLCS